MVAEPRQHTCVSHHCTPDTPTTRQHHGKNIGLLADAAVIKEIWGHLCLRLMAHYFQSRIEIGCSAKGLGSFNYRHHEEMGSVKLLNRENFLFEFYWTTTALPFLKSHDQIIVSRCFTSTPARMQTIRNRLGVCTVYKSDKVHLSLISTNILRWRCFFFVLERFVAGSWLTFSQTDSFRL